MPDHSRSPAWLILAICLALLIVPAALWPAPAAALPPRPPRPTATPTPPAPTPSADRTLIVLVFVSPAAMPPATWQALWTGVQWQDAFGDWHDVAGWQGRLDEAAAGVGKKAWAVADGHLGQGPFRWLIYARQGGDVVAASAPFYLPSAAGDIFEVRVAAWTTLW